MASFTDVITAPWALHKKIYNAAIGEDVDKARESNERNRANATNLANTSQHSFEQLGGQATALRDRLSQQMNGQHSVAAEQLRQGMQQGVNAQRSLAQAGGPNSAMAARMAANNMARISYGLSGQQALAGLQEQNNAATQLQNLLLQQRQQELNAALNARQQAMNPIGEKSKLDQYAPIINAAVAGAGKAAGGV